MPRRPRIELEGYHHVYNRGVAKNNVFKDNKDKEKFLDIVDLICINYNLNLHAFALMDNHYHLLVENIRENLSNAMRQINSRYAVYFNKRHNRVGHLWEDRYKSWYVLGDNYLFKLYRYIEYNPVKAKMSSQIGEYPYSTSYQIKNGTIMPSVSKSFVLTLYDTAELFKLLQIPLSQEEEKTIEQLHKNRYKVEDNIVIQERSVPLKEFFKEIKNKKERNLKIIQAVKHGYTQGEVARELKMVQQSISGIIKNQ